MPNKEEIKALETIASLGIKDKAAIDAQKLCETYEKMRPALEKVAPLLALIPTYGVAVGAALGVLTGIANQLCPPAKT